MGPGAQQKEDTIGKDLIKKGQENPIAQYCIRQSVRLTPLLEKLHKESSEISFMTASADVMQMNMFLMELIKAKKVLEIGVFNGSNALAAALTVPDDGYVYGFDVNDEPFRNVGQKYFAESGVEHKFKLMVGPALEHLENLLVEKLDATVDYAFIDADKENYDNYYELCLKLLRPGGIIAIDNALWGGRVVDYVPGKYAEKPFLESATSVMVALNKKIHADERVNCSLLPIGDGLMLAFKR